MIADRESKELHLVRELLRDLWRVGRQVQAGYGQNTPMWENHRRALDAAGKMLDAAASDAVGGSDVPKPQIVPDALTPPSLAASRVSAEERASKGEFVSAWLLLIAASVAAWILFLLWGSRSS